ncbi:MAG TPA: RDD family protein [Pyrinomonadaceae bacterium]|nr:RDD family protein [Pyrinomonadaceae bacterium]
MATAQMPAQLKSRAPQQSLARLRAPFALRCGAILVDYIILAAILASSTLISRLLGGGARTAGTSSETLAVFLVLVVAVLNLGVLAGLTGLTIGKWATGLRICRADGRDIGIGRAFLRHFVGYPISFFIFGIGFLMAAFIPGNRALHDWVADTVVVRDVGIRR